MKTVLLAATLCTVLNTLTFASEQPLTTQSTTTLSDVQQVFQVNISQPLQLATLSQKEMKETEGAWGPGGAIIGGIGGATGYLLSTQISSSPFSWAQLGTATAFAAANGAFAGPVGVIWGFNSAIAGGTLNGIFGRP